MLVPRSTWAHFSEAWLVMPDRLDFPFFAATDQLAAAEVAQEDRTGCAKHPVRSGRIQLTSRYFGEVHRAMGVLRDLRNTLFATRGRKHHATLASRICAYGSASRICPLPSLKEPLRSIQTMWTGASDVVLSPRQSRNRDRFLHASRRWAQEHL